MGSCAEKCAKEYNISREDQDRFAVESYNRAREAMKSGIFADEIVALEGPKKRGSGNVTSDLITLDEEPNSVNLDKLPSLRAAFDMDGSVTAGNASSINDGAAALVLMGESHANEMGLKPLGELPRSRICYIFFSSIACIVRPFLRLPVAWERTLYHAHNDVVFSLVLR